MLTFLRRFVTRATRWASHRRQVQCDSETGSKFLLQIVASPDALADHAKSMYMETLCGKFGEGVLIDEIMIEILDWEFGL